jgi:hypothetical protein
MILPLRIRHRRIFTVLGVVLPVAFGLGIAARKPVPQMSVVPTSLRGGAIPDAIIVWQRDDLFAASPVQVQLLREDDDSRRLALSCAATGDFVKPDLLVYWSATSNITASLPKDAMLLGAFASLRLPLPSETTRSEGTLILFSLADQEVVAASQRIRFNDSSK